jgi:hypothetical protein
VSFKLLTSARVICNIVCASARSNQKMQCIYQTKHIEYPTMAQSNTILSHNRIKMNTHYIKVGIVRTKYKKIKLINGEASSSTIVEELASHDKRNHEETN